MARNYVNNPDLLVAMTAYRKKYYEWEEAGKGKPKIPDYIGESIWHIANNLAKKGNFSGYSNLWKEEMICDGIENCMMYLHNFNPEKSSNPFAYFTRIIWFAFIRRIQKEKKQQYIKYKLSMNIEGEFDADHNILTHEKGALLAEMFEPKKADKIEAPSGVEKFIEEDDE